MLKGQYHDKCGPSSKLALGINDVEFFFKFLPGKLNNFSSFSEECRKATTESKISSQSRTKAQLEFLI
jgi:hypothetical protein